MSGPDWRPLRGVDPRRMSEARLQAHYALQWLARAARGYCPPQPDDSHTNLGWDDGLNGFTTHPLKGGVKLGLRMADCQLVLLDGAKAAQSFSVQGRTDAQVRQWLGEQLGTRGFDAKLLDASSPYEMPAHAIAKGAIYAPVDVADALSELAAWYANSNRSLGSVKKQIESHKLEAAPVRCWPHHFDLATLASIPARGAKEAGSVGVGISPGDEYYDESYFYVSVYPEPDAASLPKLPKLGHWHTHEFMAAIAPAHKIVAAKEQGAETDAFLRGAVESAIKILS